MFNYIYKSSNPREIMFDKLRDKLKNWTQGLIKKAVVDEVEKVAKKEEEKLSKEKKKAIKKEGKKKFKEKVQEELQEEIKPIEEHEYVEAKPKVFDREEREISEKVLEDIKVEEKKKQGLFKKIFSSITKIKISEEEFKKYSEDLEYLLLENNVALEVSEKIIEELKEKLTGKEFSKKEIEKEIKNALKEIIEEILIDPFDLIEKIKQKKEPYIILFCGINGSGKTTTIAKFASKLKKEKISCIMAGADTFRAAAIDQIKKHGEKLQINVITHEYGTDPASVGFDAIQYAKKNKIKCVLIDTAGRIHTSKNLMAEIEKINRVCNPDSKIFVGESITGNDAVEQVKSFDEAVKIDGIILSKADVDEKGGTALSVGYVTKKPVLYLGTGQEYDKLEKFNKQEFIKDLGL